MSRGRLPGRWELHGPSAGFQQVLLTFTSGAQLDLSVRRQSFGQHGASYVVLQMYRRAGEVDPEID
jgi:hypothetical protein